MKHEPFNESTEMYLKTVSELSADDEHVPISLLARHLGVSTVSATEMVHRLEDQGLVEHTPYKGIFLTADGNRRATEVIRSHQLWECFLADHLQLPWERVHELACRLEHATDHDVTDALADFLDHPTSCPHGNPIPDADGNAVATAGVALNRVETGQQGVLHAIHPESTVLLEYLARHKLKPGRAITVKEIAPFNGPITVLVDGEEQTIGQEAAGHIFLRLREG
ncbi:MAG: metal-dependent transcriptional regulator [Candidatus Promineifilaceae bacterium]|nr:metal-dependent transcriptional regulator [Candidatus Promineifilaceae bacterium]